MNYKQDLRIVKTKNSLQNSMFELLNEKSFTHITVDELCKRAKVNRMTFYNHYKDKYELFNDLISELKINLLTEFETKTQNIVIKENIPYVLSIAVEICLDACLKYQNIIFLIIKDEENSLIQYIINKALNNSVTVILETIDINHFISFPIPLIASYLTGGFTSLILYWLSHQDTYTKDDLIELIKKLINDSYETIIKMKNS